MRGLVFAPAVFGSGVAGGATNGTALRAAAGKPGMESWSGYAKATLKPW